MNRGTVKGVALLTAAVIMICGMFGPVSWTAGPGTAEAAAESVEESAETEETSFDGEIAGVITAAVVLCGVVIIVVNGRSRRK